jgi:alpha-beta hydrolase superfamily lysophospholipase
MPITLSSLLLVPCVFVLMVAGAVVLGGPADIRPLASINAPFEKVDFSAVPPSQRFTARDGTALAWLHYPATTAAAAQRRVVLVHGSSARAQSMHVLAQALAAAGFDVAALDMRGHGESGTRGQAAYIGQLEDDVEDFMRRVPFAGPSTLLGFSSGGGFVLRFAGSARQALFDRYLLLSPYLHHRAPTNRPSMAGSGTSWVSVGLPRMVALTVLNAAGITRWNHLPVLQFALNEFSQKLLTPSYSYTLAANFRPHDDYLSDIRQVRQPLRIVAGLDDELFDANGFAPVFAQAGQTVPVTLVARVNHIGLTLQPQAVAAVVKACGD